MIDLLFIFGLTIWATIVGLALMDCLIERPSDAFALAIPLGFGILALATLGLGEIGHLHASGMSSVLGVGIVFALIQRAYGARRTRLLGNSERPAPIKARLSYTVAIPAAIAVLGTLLTALAPATDGDALCYHLQVPKVFLNARSTTFEPDLHETIYPLVTEMLYAVGLMVRGTISCRLVQWIFGLCFAANVTALARPILANRAWWAGSIALLVPAVSNGMGAPLNDVSLAAFSNATLVAYFVWKDRPSFGSALLTGIFAGLAVGVKYPALVWVALIGVSMLLTHAPRIRLFHVLAFAAATIIVGGTWYLRAYHYTGNPVYPFFRSLFGGSGIDDVLDPIKRPMPVTPWNLLTAVAPMTLQPDRFDSLSHQFGPVFLVFAPAIVLFRMPKRLCEILAIGFAFLTICLTQRQSMRFVLAAVGPLSVAAAWAISSWSDRRTIPSRCVVGIIIAVLFFEATIAAGRARHGLSVVFGRESVETYLSRREPTYPVGRWIDANLAKSARIVGQEHRGFYVPRPYSMELAHRRRTGLGTHHETANQVVEALRADGFTHVLLCPPVPESAVEFDPFLSRRLEGWTSHRTPLYTRDIEDPDGVTRRYQIYELNPSPALAGSREASS